MELPKKHFINGKNYDLIKEYKNFGLYENEKGIRECFTPFELGLVEQKFDRILHKELIHNHF